MASVIVPKNLNGILRDPTTPPTIDQNLVQRIQTEKKDMPIIILGEKCFLHLLAYERQYLAVHAPNDIYTYPISDANRLAEYLVYFCYLPEDTYTIDFITNDTKTSDEQHVKCFLQTLAHYLHQQLHRYSTRVTYCGQPIKFPRSTQQPSRVFGFFARTFNRYGEPQQQFVHATPDMSQPNDTADQTYTSPNSSKPH